MPTPIDPFNSDITLDSLIHGYLVEKIMPLKEINAVLYRLVHQATGARHVHISRPDEENTFGVTFKTVPADSTGVAHILEHTVLCGSRKFPVRDPFFSMLKRSLSTFMNAFTASDWTMYPFSTQNAKDYYNLMDVYLDAAFFPVLGKLSFKQEGHRLEFEPETGAAGGDRLVYKGVVYNEMKGAMSSPDQVMGRSLLNAMYPDTTYSNNSGGDPAVIPGLTHDQLVAFHQRHYHPSNAYFYTYGNLPLKAHLAAIADRVMRHFSPIDPKTDVPSQPRWTEPRTARYTYPLAANEDATRKCQVCLAWLACDVNDTFDVLVLAVLEQILLGNAGSPLRKALMDSGLGSALCDVTGYDAENRDTLFACGLKDVSEEGAEAVEKIILDVFQGLVRDKIDPELIAAAIHQIEFHRKEITNTPYPYGLKLLLSIIGSWLHGGDPERILQLDADIERLQQEIAKGPFLEGKIQAYFLDNPHRTRLILAPDQEQSGREETRVTEELKDRKARLSQTERETIVNDARRLEELQEAQEDISCLPTLALADIPPEIQIHTPSRVPPGLALWSYVQPTSGIFYFNAAAGAAAVPADMLPWVPFFCYAFSKVGTAHYDYTQMARRIDLVTGGFSMASQARMLYDSQGGCLPIMSLHAKCLARNLDATVSIVEDLISGADFSDLRRLKQLLGEYQAGLESMIVQNGHRLAISLSGRSFSPASALSEIWSGVHHVQTIRTFSRQTDTDNLQPLADILNSIARAVFSADNVVMAAIGENEVVDQAGNLLSASKVLQRFQRQDPVPRLAAMAYPTGDSIPYEGWSTSSAVAFVAQTVNTVPLTHADAPALAVLSKLVRSLYLHREIREKGGAYGGFAQYNPESGLFSMASYRDPHVVRTMQVFAGITEFIKSADISDEDVKEAILQVCSEIDRPDPPGPAARKAFSRMLVGLSDEARRNFKYQLLKVSRDQLRDVAARYGLGDQKTAGVAVIAGQSQLVAANAQLGQRPLALKVI